MNEANERIIARTAELKDARNRLKSASDTADAIASFLEVIDFVISLIAPLGFDSPQINVLNTFATLPAGDVDQELPYTHLIDIVSNSYLLASLSNTAEIDRMLIHGYALRLHRSILVISSLGYSHATMQFVARVTEIADRIQALLQVRGSISQAPQDLKDLMEACEAVVVYHP
ncbi:MAG: hypothetical protein KME02_07905 [Aphanothece saxicola GSE-SYN-MK-01-06B]|nr:hypothetical protein [Aphanothece saxicola GSE-SYN-MK-01-06B]